MSDKRREDIEPDVTPDPELLERAAAYRRRLAEDHPLDPYTRDLGLRKVAELRAELAARRLAHQSRKDTPR